MAIHGISGHSTFPPGNAVTVALANSGRGQNCNCNPQLLAGEYLVDCNKSVSYGMQGSCMQVCHLGHPLPAQRLATSSVIRLPARMSYHMGMQKTFRHHMLAD